MRSVASSFTSLLSSRGHILLASAASLASFTMLRHGLSWGGASAKVAAVMLGIVVFLPWEVNRIATQVGAAPPIRVNLLGRRFFFGSDQGHPRSAHTSGGEGRDPHALGVEASHQLERETTEAAESHATGHPSLEEDILSRVQNPESEPPRLVAEEIGASQKVPPVRQGSDIHRSSEGFTSKQAARFSGCTAHELRYWDRIALIKPSLQSTRPGVGARRLYSFRDVVQLRVVKSLLEHGMSLQRVRRAYSYLRKEAALDDHLSSVKLVTDGASIFKIASSDEQLLDVLREGQLTFVVAIDEIARQTHGAVADYLYDREEFVHALRRVERAQAEEIAARARRTNADPHQSAG